MKNKTRRINRLWSVIMLLVSLLYMYPIFMVLMNSLKIESAISTSTAFELPTAETFAGLANYENAINAQGFLSSFFYTAFITITPCWQYCSSAPCLPGISPGWRPR